MCNGQLNMDTTLESATRRLAPSQIPTTNPGLLASVITAWWVMSLGMATTPLALALMQHACQECWVTMRHTAAVQITRDQHGITSCEDGRAAVAANLGKSCEMAFAVPADAAFHLAREKQTMTPSIVVVQSVIKAKLAGLQGFCTGNARSSGHQIVELAMQTTRNACTPNVQMLMASFASVVHQHGTTRQDDNSTFVQMCGVMMACVWMGGQQIPAQTDATNEPSSHPGDSRGNLHPRLSRLAGVFADRVSGH